MRKLLKQPKSSKYLAFLIGVSDYEHWNPLRTPLNDIQVVGELLASGYGYQVAYAENPTLSELEAFVRNSACQVEETAKQLGTNEPLFVLFFYAGHGYQLSNNKGFEGFLIPRDASQMVDSSSWYSLKDLTETLQTLPCRHLLLVLDCCHSGAVRWAAGHRGLTLRSEKLYRQHYKNFTSRRSFQALVSTAPDQFAYDSVNGSAHSPFAHHFIEGLRGEADYPPDKVITCPELFAYVQLRLEANAGQNAGLFPLAPHDQGEYLFLLDGFNPDDLELQEFYNPYKGLNVYEATDAPFFFGREEAIQSLLTSVKKQSLTVVVGASGTGKSSLVKAGILPRLTGDCQEMYPGRNPMAEAAKLTDFDVLVIDQFEQLITQSDNEKVTPFFQKMEQWLQTGKKIIVTLRIDFEKRLPIPESLRATWEAGQFFVPVFTAEELRQVIIIPAMRVGRFITPLRLVDTIIEEVIHYPGSLPLLSFTMQQLFEKCKTDPYRNIREDDYRALNGVIGALQASADSVLAGFRGSERETMRHVMLRMVSLSGGETAGRRVLKSELVFDDPAENKRIEKVLKVLDEERLIRAGKDSEGREFYEPSHDALVQVWQQMQEWMKGFTNDNILLHARLQSAVSEYSTKGNNWRQLWHFNPNRRLVLKAEKDAGAAMVLNKKERQFVVRSKQLSQRIWGAMGTVILAVMMGLSGLTWWALSEQEKAELNAMVANKQTEIANEKTTIAEQQTARAEKELRDRLNAEQKERTERLNKLIAEGNGYRQQKEFDMALKFYRDAKEVGVENADQQLDPLIAQTEKEKNDYEFDLNFNTGLALKDANQFKAALIYLEKARKSRPDNESVKKAIEECRK